MPGLASSFMADQDQVRPLQHFHSVKGPNISLSEDATVATRTTSFLGGLTFSAQPLQPNELFLVEIERNDYGWNGSLRIGITQSDPSERKQLLPSLSVPDLVTEGFSWMYTFDPSEVDEELRNNFLVPPSKLEKLLRAGRYGSRINMDLLKSQAIPSRTSPRPRSQSRKNSYNDEFRSRLQIDNLSGSPKPSAETCNTSTCEGSRVGIFYTLEADDLAYLYFIVSGECRGPFPLEIETRSLYVVCDVYGCTKTVKLLPVYQVPDLKCLCRDAILNTARKLEDLPLPNRLKRYLKFD